MDRLLRSRFPTSLATTHVVLGGQSPFAPRRTAAASLLPSERLRKGSHHADLTPLTHIPTMSDNEEQQEQKQQDDHINSKSGGADLGVDESTLGVCPSSGPGLGVAVYDDRTRPPSTSALPERKDGCSATTSQAHSLQFCCAHPSLRFQEEDTDSALLPSIAVL